MRESDGRYEAVKILKSMFREDVFIQYESENIVRTVLNWERLAKLFGLTRHV